MTCDMCVSFGLWWKVSGSTACARSGHALGLEDRLDDDNGRPDHATCRQSECGDRTEEGERRRDADRRGEPVDERLRRRVAAGPGEDRDGDRDAEDAAELANHRVDAGSLADGALVDG